MAVATHTDVGVALRRTISDPAEQAQVERWLTGVELLIQSRLGPVGALDVETVKYVEAEVVAEKVRRAGRTESSITVSADDGSVTRRYDNRVTSGDVADDLWALFGSGVTSSAYSAPVTSPLDLP